MLTLADRLHDGIWTGIRGLPLGERFWEDRTLRGTVMAVAHLVVAFVAMVLGPVWLMLLAPLLFGVPHVVADIRHLVLDPPHKLTRGLVPLLLLTFGAMTATRVVYMAGGPHLAVLELILGAVSVGLAIAWARGRPLLRLALGLGLLALVVPMVLWPRQSALIIGHAHNFVAVGIWFLWSGVRGGARWIFVSAVVLANALILGGAVDGLLLPHAWQAEAGGLSFGGLVDTLAPDLPLWLAPRVVLSFALMQAVHYSMWVWCIPQAVASRREEAPVTPTARWRGWRKHLGLIGIGLVLIGVVALPAAGVAAPAGARGFYLSLVLFHGWLELAIVAHLVVIGGVLAGARAAR